MAFRAFFALLFGGKLPDDLAAELGLSRKSAPPPKTQPAPQAPPSPPAPQVKLTDGALQLLGMLQREARFLDFLMEEIAPYSDEQVGSAAREVHDTARDLMIRHFAPVPVIDAMEGSVVNAPDGGPALVKYIGNVPASGKPASGALRHRGWRATSAGLPQLNSRQDLTVLAPAEIEVE
jgi:hypothetical protein